MTATGKPDFRKGDYVGFTDNVTWSEGGRVDTNAYIVAEPFLVKGKWHVAFNFDPDRFKSYWASYAAKNDKNISAENVYLIERKTNKLKEFTRTMKLSKPAIVTAIVLGFVAIIGLWLAGNYNSLVVANNAVDNSKSKIDTQLERRYELIDNIVSSVEGSQAQESDVFGKIAEARKIGSSANSETAKADANAAIDTQIALLPRLQEAYPELRSNDQVTRLITELQGSAGQVATARDTYNDTVTNYNNNITQFPKSVFANVFNFDKKELFKASKAAETNPQVKIERP